ncbi:MAG: NAD(P)/FAD-dependent oxidoreductase [Bacteroidales bacterium]|nr:NAD(P)/FAD-dependent oxidoreductase [Bacteroidales bacterium]MBN2758842.1 NAD(P)/FAD-dependent oxidoreductase [Bacteroidales bacterium]
MNNYDVIVVGAGPAGIIAAGRAAELGAKVLLLEKKERAGRKLLITGKGRCNITNKSYKSEHFKNIFPDGKFLKHAYSTFFVDDILQLLESHGLETSVERGSRVFPTSDNAGDVLKALMSWLSEKKVDIRYKSKVTEIITENKAISALKFLYNSEIYEVSAKSVIVAAGGNSYPATGSDGQFYKVIENIGQKIEKVRPALVPLNTEGDIAEKLMGLSLKNANASLWVGGKKIKEEFGEMLFTHFGLSGPIILTLSRFVVDELMKNNKVEISIDLKPALDDQKLDNRLVRDLNENGKKQIANVFKLWLPAKLIPVFLELTKIDASKECHQISAKERKEIRVLMKDFRLNVTGSRSFKEAIITAGGVSTKEIDSKTMESKIVKNLFFAGEIIDLDANTGGYNLQIAYSTAWLAAQSAV